MCSWRRIVVNPPRSTPQPPPATFARHYSIDEYVLLFAWLSFSFTTRLPAVSIRLALRNSLNSNKNVRRCVTYDVRRVAGDGFTRAPRCSALWLSRNVHLPPRQGAAGWKQKNDASRISGLVSTTGGFIITTRLPAVM